MAMIDDIMQQLSQMGINLGGGYMDIASISPATIASRLQSQHGLTSEQLPSSLFTPIGGDVLRGALSQTYSPQIESTGATLLSGLQSSLAGKKGRQAFGGFAGSGQQQDFIGGAKDVYGKGMTDVLTQTGQQQAQSLKSILDMINQWHSQASQIRYG